MLLPLAFSTTFQIKVLAFHKGLELVVNMGPHNVIIESDSLHQTISAIREASLNVSPMGPLIEDAKFLPSLVPEVTSTHVQRQANYVAHHLARFALHTEGDRTWFDEVPSIVSDHIVEEAP